jgi:hypothetical protein
VPRIPDIPDVPGKSLITGTTKRARVVAGAAAGGALAVGGIVAKRVLGHGGAEERDEAMAEPADNVEPIAKAKPAAPKAKAAKPKPAKPKPPKPKAAKPKPPSAAKPKGPHQALNNPVGEPDETEYPDPYETRPDPRDPVDPDGAPFGEEPHPATGSESTSEPPLEDDPEHPEGGRPPRRDNLDD